MKTPKQPEWAQHGGKTLFFDEYFRGVPRLLGPAGTSKTRIILAYYSRKRVLRWGKRLAIFAALITAVILFVRARERHW